MSGWTTYSPNARVWRAFLDECEVFDMDMVTESRDGLDMLLVFTGLFSAVLSTFIVQTSQALSANFPAVSSSLLVEMVALQRAQINNTPINDILPADTSTGPSGFDVWVNALWFTSLTLSLGTALMAVLVKQWLYQYMSMISGTARDRSLIQFYRFEGLQKWHVRTIIGTLPIILHVALGLFLAGLVVFLIPLNIPLACVVGFITLIVYASYAVSNILSLIYTQCPYRTPFSDILNVMLRAVRTFLSLVAMHVRKKLSVFHYVTSTITAGHVFRTLKDSERIAATDDGVAEEVALRALLWLYEMTSNPPTKRIIQESLGCLSDDVSKRPKELQADLEQTLDELSPLSFDYEGKVWYRSILSGQEHRAERILRAVRDPLAPRDGLILPDALWKLDVADTGLSFKILTSILVHAPSISVEMDKVRWDLPSLLRYLVINQYGHTPILLPRRLWTLVVTLISSDPENYDDDFLFHLCNHAVNTFDSAVKWTDSPPPSPFAGPVTADNKTVPLFHLVLDLLVRTFEVPHVTDPFGFEPLTQLFTIYDYITSESSFDFNAAASVDLAMEQSTWGALTRLDNIRDNDKTILCRRVENAALKMVVNDDWWDDQEEGWRCRCYVSLLSVHLHHNLADWYSNGSDFFRKLLSDLSLSLTRTRNSPHLDYLFYKISRVLQDLLKQHKNVPLYFSLFCAAPFLSTRNLSSYTNCLNFLYPVVSTFVEAAGKMHRDIVLQSLFTEPQRFYTICWILALGGPTNRYDDWEEHRRATFLQLAHIDPTHVVWESRAHYMTMEPQDWPYLRLFDKDLENEVVMAWIRKKMNVCLQILDEFFASLNTSSLNDLNANQDGPPQNTTPQITPSSNAHWRHIRQLVSGTKGFLGLPSASHSSPSDVANDIELGLRPELSRVQSGEAGPHAEPDTHALRSSTPHSSCSSGTNTARSFHSFSSSNVPHPNPAAPPSSEFPMTPAQNAELSTVSAPTLETSFPLSEKTEDATDVASGYESARSNIHSFIRTTPSVSTTHSSGSLHSAISDVSCSD